MFGELPEKTRWFSINKYRLILYFPVSALVTLFANILQNPQDARARTDVKLMNHVVDFLSMLAVTEEQGGVKRMLGICSEFERIARVVIDKGDKESHSRRKRKNKDSADDTLAPLQPVNNPPSTPASNNPTTPANLFSPTFTNMELNNHPFNPSLNNIPSPFANGDSMSLPLDFNPSPSAAFSTNMSPPNLNGLSPSFSNDFQQQYSSDGTQLNINSFQQPFVPQDLWQMQMTLDWDWADMTNTGYPSYESVDAQLQSQNPIERK